MHTAVHAQCETVHCSVVLFFNQLSCVKFSTVKLSCVKLSHVQLSNCQLFNCPVSNCQLFNCPVSNCPLSNCPVFICHVSNCPLFNYPVSKCPPFVQFSCIKLSTVPLFFLKLSKCKCPGMNHICIHLAPLLSNTINTRLAQPCEDTKPALSHTHTR